MSAAPTPSAPAPHPVHKLSALATPFNIAPSPPPPSAPTLTTEEFPSLPAAPSKPKAAWGPPPQSNAPSGRGGSSARGGASAGASRGQRGRGGARPARGRDHPSPSAVPAPAPAAPAPPTPTAGTAASALMAVLGADAVASPPSAPAASGDHKPRRDRGDKSERSRGGRRGRGRKETGPAPAPVPTVSAWKKPEPPTPTNVAAAASSAVQSSPPSSTPTPAPTPIVTPPSKTDGPSSSSNKKSKASKAADPDPLPADEASFPPLPSAAVPVKKTAWGPPPASASSSSSTAGASPQPHTGPTPPLTLAAIVGTKAPPPSASGQPKAAAQKGDKAAKPRRKKEPKAHAPAPIVSSPLRGDYGKTHPFFWSGEPFARALEFLGKADLIQSRQVCRAWKDTVDVHAVAKRPSLRCFSSGAAYDSGDILGIGAWLSVPHAHAHHGHVVQYLVSSFDFLSHSAYSSGVRASPSGEKFELFLPLYLNPAHARDGHAAPSKLSVQHLFEQACVEAMNSSQAAVGRDKPLTPRAGGPSSARGVTKFAPEYALKVLARLMTHLVLTFIKDDEHDQYRDPAAAPKEKDKERGEAKEEAHHSQAELERLMHKALQAYCFAYHMLLACVRWYPSIAGEAEKMVSRFVDSESHRAKRYTPNLNEMFIFLILSKRNWKDVGPAILWESYNRSVRWGVKECPELEYVMGTTPPSGPALTVEERLKKMFDSSITGKRLLLFQFFLLQEVGRPRGSTFEQQFALYNRSLGFPQRTLIDRFHAFSKEVHAVSSWSQFYSLLQLPFPGDEKLSKQLEQSVVHSARLGYHHPRARIPQLALAPGSALNSARGHSHTPRGTTPRPSSPRPRIIVSTSAESLDKAAEEAKEHTEAIEKPAQDSARRPSPQNRDDRDNRDRRDRDRAHHDDRDRERGREEEDAVSWRRTDDEPRGGARPDPFRHFHYRDRDRDRPRDHRDHRDNHRDQQGQGRDRVRSQTSRDRRDSQRNDGGRRDSERNDGAAE